MGLFPLCLLLQTGCVQALRPHGQASIERFRIEVAQPEKYFLRVAGNPTNYAIGIDGRVEVFVPGQARGCDQIFLGAVKVHDASGHNRKAITLLKEGRELRKYSINDIAPKPIDALGFRLLQ